MVLLQEDFVINFDSIFICDYCSSCVKARQYFTGHGHLFPSQLRMPPWPYLGLAHILQTSSNAANRPLLGARRRGVGGSSGGVGGARGRQGDGAGGAVLLEDAPEDDALVDSRGLLGVLGDVGAAVDALLEHAEVVLALAADVVGQGLGDLGEGVVAGGVEDLGGAARGVGQFMWSLSWVRCLNLLGVEVEGETEVVEDALGEGGVEEDLALLDVAEQDQAVWVDTSLGRGVKEGTSLEDELVGAEVVALHECKLVLVR